MRFECSNWSWVRGKYLMREIDQRSMNGRETLLSLSKERGLVPRSELGFDGDGRADSLVGYKRVDPGVLVMNKMQAWNGMFGLSGLAGVVSPEYTTLVPISTSDPRFLVYLLKSDFYVGEFSWRSRGMGTAFLRLHPENLLATPFYVPSVDVQRAIADYLDTETARIDGLIAKKQQMIELLRELEVAVLESLLLLGDSSGDGRFEGEWHTLLPSGWSLSPIKRLAECANSGAWGGDPGAHEIDLPVATTAQIDSEGHFHIEEMAVRSFTLREEAQYGCRPGDIVVVKSSGSATNIISGKAGLVSEVNEGFIFSNFLMRLRPDTRRVDPKFLYLALVSHLTRQRIERMVSATTYPNLQVGEYLSASLPLPPVAVQRQLLAEYDRRAGGLRLLRGELNRSINLLRERRQALITAAVTGDLQIRGVVA